MIKKINGFFVMIFTLIAFSNISNSEIIDKIVAVVNDDIITLVELNKAIEPYLAEVEKSAYDDPQKEKIISKLQKDMLTKMIEFKLTEQEAERFNITVSDDELDSSIQRFLEHENITKEDLKKALAKEKMTYEAYKNEMRGKILRPKLINLVIKSKVVITNEEITEYYDEHESEYAGRKKYHLRNILVDEEEEIKKVKVILDMGEDFKEVAKEYSEASNASSGGDLGTFELDFFADNIRESICLLEKGKYTDIISTDSGFQIFLLENIEVSDATTIEQAKEEITRKLFSVKAEKKYLKWFEELKGMSLIKITL